DYERALNESDQGNLREISETGRQRGFGLDMPALMFTGGRSDVAESLTARGWRMESLPVDDLFRRYGIEAPT
ncbi:MAG: SAM-dependent methyltransferase, partial [Mycobacterium sp.]